MNCNVCLRHNLPGGVRCIYCGEPFPPVLDFDMALSPRPAPSPATTTGGTSAPTSRKSAGLLGTLAVLALKAKSLLALLKFGKIATTLFSMLFYIWVYAGIFGWKFGVGIALSILIHEMGHVVVNWRKGLKQTAPMFIPFVGAVIFIKQFPDDPTIQSESGAGGPVAGMLAAVVCLLIGWWTKSPFWFALANLGFLINLFNLIPFPPLDGSHISSVFSPQIWSAVLIGLLLFALKAPASLLWGIIVVGFLFRLGSKENRRYLLAAPKVRLRMAAVYLALCIGLSVGTTSTMQYRRYRTMAGSPSTARQLGSPAPAEAPDTAEESASPAKSWSYADASPEARGFVWVAAIGLFFASLCCWVITSALLAVASGRRYTLHNLGLLAFACGLYALLFWLTLAVPVLSASILPIAGAYLAATLAALCYAGYMAAYRKPGAEPTHAAVLARSLAWAFGAALLVAYASNNLIVIGLSLPCVFAFYLMFPWILFSFAGTLAEKMGDDERAMTLRRRAIALCPDPLNGIDLWTRIARQNVALARGGPALEALHARDALAVTPQENPRIARPLDGLDLSATALLFLDRFAESITCYEQLLQTDTEEMSPEARLLTVHLRLITLARLRGWNDEALAQADWCLAAIKKSPGTLKGTINALRADALTELGKTEEARAACEQALASSREPSVEAHVALVRARLALKSGDTTSAEKESSRAIRILPGHLEVRYWRGRALLASGKRIEGETLLQALVRDHAREHWGKRAASA